MSREEISGSRGEALTYFRKKKHFSRYEFIINSFKPTCEHKNLLSAYDSNVGGNIIESKIGGPL